MRRTFTFLLVLFVVLILIFMFTACQPVVWNGNSDSQKLIAIGDSITALSEEEIRGEAEFAYYVSVNATSGYSSTQSYMSTALYPQNAAQYGVVVWNAGINDYPRVDMSQTFKNIQAARDHLGGKCFYASTLSTSTYEAARNEWNAWFNFYLVFSNDFLIVDFGGFADQNPQYFPDGVHPDQDAQWLYTGMILAAANKC